MAEFINYLYVQIYQVISENCRFGIILSLTAMEPIKKDEECFAHYGYRDPRYTLKIAPKWYKALYEKFVKNQPTNNEE